MTDWLVLVIVASALMVFYAFLIWHAAKQGKSMVVYVLLAVGNIAVGLYCWEVVNQPSHDPQAGMGLGLFVLACMGISALLPLIAFVVFLMRTLRP